VTVWAIIPARPLEEGKSRLAEALTQGERSRLNQEFFRRTLDIASSVVGKAHTLVVSRSQSLLATAHQLDFPTLHEQPPYGLNEALTQAAESARRQGATAVLSVSCDLPFLTADELRALLAAAEGGLAIAGDRAGTGTNAMVVSPVGAIPYRYGPGSFLAHRQEAAAAGLPIAIVRKPGLSFDIDTPDDLEQMEDMGRERVSVGLVTSTGCAFP
jgi:2-phospho-L-lactate guanylyltransferase